jgi:hypothetical protein
MGLARDARMVPVSYLHPPVDAAGTAWLCSMGPGDSIDEQAHGSYAERRAAGVLPKTRVRRSFGAVAVRATLDG